MNRLFRAVIVLLAVGCLNGRGAEQKFYLSLRAFVATNGEAWEVRSPSFVDTNNTGFKLTNVIRNLSSMRSTGTLAGVRPGLTMDEVVALWGKPMELWVKGFGGPRLRYREVNVFFDPTGNKVRSVYTEDLPSLMRRLEITPKIEDCLRALGEPSYRDISSTGGSGVQMPQTRAEQEQFKSAPVMWTFLVYQTAQIRLKVGCERGKLSTLQLELAE